MARAPQRAFSLAPVIVSTSRMGVRRRWEQPAEDSDENLRLRSQVKQMQDRINVLEKIVTDKGAQTAAQIEALRERDRISEGDGQ